MVMEEEVKYTSEFDGQTTDEVLKHAKSVKDLTIPSLSNISGFVCIDNEGKAIGMMSKEQVSQVVGGLLPVATLTQKGLMDSYHTRSIGDGFVVNAGSGHKGKYVKLFTINNYNGTIATVEMCSYGNSSSFLLAISLGNGTQSVIAFRNGKLLLGSLSGFKFYVVGLSVYMFVPASIKDCYVYVSNRQGTVHDGKDILDSIDTSVEISIS